MIDVCPATEAHILSFYGKPVGRTVRAVAAIRGNKVVALGGLYTDRGRRVMFMERSPEFRFTFEEKKALVRGYRMLLEFVKDSKIPVHALADSCIEKSVNLLQHIGFSHVRDGIYQWRG